MTFEFKLNLAMSIGREEAPRGAMIVSDEARRLAEQVNKRRSDQQLKSQTQLHKAEILKSKGHDFWNEFAIVLRREVEAFNNYLDHDEDKVSIDDTTKIFHVYLKSSRSEFDCFVNLPGQVISITGKGHSIGEVPKFNVKVDSNDEIKVHNNAGGGGGVESLQSVAIKILAIFA